VWASSQPTGASSLQADVKDGSSQANDQVWESSQPTGASIQQADVQDGSIQANDSVWASSLPTGASNLATIRIFTNNC
jgi:hypothetical protein